MFVFIIIEITAKNNHFTISQNNTHKQSISSLIPKKAI